MNATGRHMWIAAIIAATIAASCGSAIAQSSSSVSDQAVQKAMDKSIAYLWSRWNEKTCWDSPPDPKASDRQKLNYGGYTALATYALLAAGVDPKEERMARSIKRLLELPAEGTYVLSLRANVLSYLPQRTYRSALIRDVTRLSRSFVADRKSSRYGGFTYPALGRTPPKAYADNSNSQFALLGIWAGKRRNVEVPMEFWKIAESYWLKCQNRDGGWSYGGTKRPSYGSMTAAGLASMFVCYDSLHSREFITCKPAPASYKPIQNGLNWFVRRYSPTENPGRKAHYYYYLYGVERVGLASGYKYFGTRDWYKLGAARLLATQSKSNGSYGGTLTSTAFCLLFLARGRSPIMFNHLEYDGDWNNRPRALANLTRWAGTTFETEFAWQIVNLKVPAAEWHDSPILYLSGSRRPKLTAANLDKLREYVWQGGTLLTITECGGQGFDRAARRMYGDLFPKYELVRLPQDHPLFTLHFKLRRRPQVYAVSNGLRLLGVHVAADLPRSWQTYSISAGRSDYEFAANLYFYVTDFASLHTRGAAVWPMELRGGGGAPIRLARIKHNAVCTPEPLAWRRFALRLTGENGRVLDVSDPMPATQLDPKTHPLAHLTGMGELRLTDEQSKALKAYCLGGGTLIVDAAGGSTTFRDSVEKLLDKLFGEDSRRRLGAKAGPYALDGKEIAKVRYRRALAKRLGPDRAPRLQAVESGGRIVCIYSPEDLTAGLVGYQQHGLIGYAPDPDPTRDSAYQVMRNIVLWAAKSAGARKTP